MVKCPYCQSDAPVLAAALTVPSDCRSDEIRFQLFRCGRCGQGSAGACEESRRGSMDSDCVDHYAYQLDPLEWQQAFDWIKLCPAPDDEDCGCCAHLRLGAQDKDGRWLGLRALRVSP